MEENQTSTPEELKNIPSTENETTNQVENKEVTKDVESKKSRSRSEVGHIKNVANFEDLISFCVSLGANYSPMKENMKIENIQALFVSSNEKIASLTSKRTTFDLATDKRRLEFFDFGSYSTRLVSAFSISGVDKLAIENAKSINSKIHGRRISKDEGKNEKTISTSQQSYDRIIDHFAKLIELFIQNPTYNPNEEELKITFLQNKLQNFKNRNTEVIDSYTSYFNSRLERNFILYDPTVGLVQIAKEIKLYIKSIYGTRSPQYKQVNKIKFVVLKK